MHFMYSFAFSPDRIDLISIETLKTEKVDIPTPHLDCVINLDSSKRVYIPVNCKIINSIDELQDFKTKFFEALNEQFKEVEEKLQEKEKK